MTMKWHRRIFLTLSIAAYFGLMWLLYTEIINGLSVSLKTIVR